MAISTTNLTHAPLLKTRRYNVITKRAAHSLGGALLGAAFITSADAAVVRDGDTVNEEADKLVTDLDPTGTFLRAPDFDNPSDAARVNLSDLGFSPGELLSIRIAGDFKFGDELPEGNTTAAVFSTSAELLGPIEALERVPGAVRAPTDGTRNVFTPNNAENLPTDIPEDFRPDEGGIARVPTGASHLFVGAVDTFFEDNTDTDGPDGDGDFGFAIGRPEIIGDSAAGSLEVDNSGTETSLTLDSLVVGNEAGVNGRVTVSGTDAVLSPERRIYAGINGAAEIEVDDGGTLNSGFINMGRGQGGEATLTVDGAGSAVNLNPPAVSSLPDSAAFLTIARNADAEVTISDGGQISIEGENIPTPGFQVSRNLGSDGSLTVTGQDSVLSVEGDTPFVAIGRAAQGEPFFPPRNNIARGSALVADGGSIEVTSTDGLGSFSLGTTARGVGTLTVAGADSRVQINGIPITVGGGGTGDLVVSNGGTVAADGINIGASGTISGAGGTISGDVIVGADGTVAPGNSTGELTFTDAVTLQQGSFLELELDDTGSGIKTDKLTFERGVDFETGSNILFSFLNGLDPNALADFVIGNFLVDESDGGLDLGQISDNVAFSARAPGFDVLIV